MVIAGSMALLAVGLARWKILAYLKDQTRREAPMVKQTIMYDVMVVGYCVLDLIWVMGASPTAGALSA